MSISDKNVRPNATMAAKQRRLGPTPILCPTSAFVDSALYDERPQALWSSYDDTDYYSLMKVLNPYLKLR
jgi:hypothetical protein